jgi:hypothetical protein
LPSSDGSRSKTTKQTVQTLSQVFFVAAVDYDVEKHRNYASEVLQTIRVLKVYGFLSGERQRETAVPSIWTEKALELENLRGEPEVEAVLKYKLVTLAKSV